MQKVVILAAAVLAASCATAGAAPLVQVAVDTGASPPALVLVADGCGPGRFRGVSGICEGRRPVTMRKVCVVHGAPYAAVRRCHMVRG